MAGKNHYKYKVHFFSKFFIAGGVALLIFVVYKISEYINWNEEKNDRVRSLERRYTFEI